MIDEYEIVNEKARILLREISPEAHFWALYFLRIAQGGKEGNYYSMQLKNGFYKVDFKITIKRLPTEKEKEQFRKLGIDIDKIIEQYKEAGLFEEENTEKEYEEETE